MKQKQTMKFEEVVITVDDRDLYPSAVPDGLKSALFSWFRYRRVANNRYFPSWYKRKIALVLAQYDQMLRVEPGISNYDWLVENYKEAQNYLVRTSESSRNTAYQDYIVEEMDGTETTYGNGSGTHNITTTSDTTDLVHTNSDSRTLTKDTPQSENYHSATDGEFPDFDWRYPGAQSETVGDDTTNDTMHNRVSDVGNTTNQNNQNTERENNTNRNSNGETSEGVRANGKDLNREMYSGRNSAPAVLLKQTVEFIQQTNSFKWLLGQLEPCFMSIYDEEDY